MKKLFLTLATFALTLGANAGETWQLGPYKYTADTLFHSTTGPGITTTGIRLVSENGTNKSNIFYSTIDLTNSNLELRGVQAKDDPDVVENVLAMGNRKNTQGNGQYMAGVNGDFFNMGGSPTRTNGHSLVDGTLYNAGVGGDGWNTWASYVTVTGKKDVIIDTGVKASVSMKFPNGTTHAYVIDVERLANYLVIYTNDAITRNQWGKECAIKLVSGTLEGRDAVFEVTTEVKANETVPADGFVLSGHGDAAEMVSQLKVGDRVSLGKVVTYQGQNIDPTQSVGGCSMIVVDGKIAPDAYFSASVIDHFTSNQARTVIGYNKDRSKLIILVCDKYSIYALDYEKDKEGNYIKDEDGKKIPIEGSEHVKDPEKRSFGTSTGMVAQRMGHIMLQLGCYTAMNFDGGGSSQLYNKELGIRNVPYGDTYYRPVANGFFAVETTPVDNEVAMLEVYQKNVKLNEGETFTPKVFGYNKYGVLVDKNVTDFTFTVAPALGSTEGTTFTAGSAAGSTHAVVAKGDIKCAVRILTNGGGAYTTSGDDEALLEIKPPYVADEPLGIDRDPIYLTEQWSFVNPGYNDGWDGAAPNWESEDAIKSKSCVRFATGRNGVLYTLDMKTMSIAEIDREGNLNPLYKLPALTGEVDGVKDYYGCAISSDDYGNFLIGHYFTKPATYRVWTVYSPKTGKAKTFEVELPEGELSNGRIDNVGRVVGNLTKDAYVYVAPKATAKTESQKTLIIHFTGDGNIDNVTATPTMSKPLYLAGAGNTFTICQPKYKTVAEMAGKDLSETFYWYSKDPAGGDGQWGKDLFSYTNAATGAMTANLCLNWQNHSKLNGFDTFLLGGKRYFALAFSSADEFATNASSQHIIIKSEAGETVAEWNNEGYHSNAGYNTITAVPVNDNQVNIYVYNCTGDFYVGEEKTGAIAGALLTLTLGEYQADETADITPKGLDFDSYEDGDMLKLTATGSNGGWSAPAGMFHKNNPNAFTDNGQLTVYLDRGAGSEWNSQEKVDADINKAFTIRKMHGNIGNVLAAVQMWSPAASRYQWPAYSPNGTQAQLNFYVPSQNITNKPDQRHYVRVRVVYNVLHRGCHYTNFGPLDLVSIYASHENNWVVPESDHELGARVATKGIDFAQWVDETGKVEDIPAVPEVRRPNADETDAWDPGHKPAAEDGNGYPAYILNDLRYRVYEFDTYIDNPSAATVSVQFNMANKNTTYLIKEITFTDLGTDEAAATLLGRRSQTWRYYQNESTGIDDIIADDVNDGSDAPAVYYNLQGVQVANPEAGVYIVRRGDKVTKEYIR